SLHEGTARLGAQSRSRGASQEAAGAAQRDQRHRAVADGSAARLHLCAALPFRDRPVPCRLSAAGGAPARPLGRVLACRPAQWRRRVSVQETGGANGAGPLVAVQGLKKHFPITKGVFSRLSGQVYAVDGVSFEIKRGETLGLVGESG